MRIKRETGARIIGSLMALFVSASLCAAQPPARLRLSVVPSAVAVGAGADVTIAFQNRDFRPVANDRDRVVRLAIRGGGGKTDAAGQIASTVRIPAGATVSSPIRLTATRAGVLRVWAESDGLAPADALVRVGAQASLLPRLFESVVHAQDAAVPFEVLGELKIPFSAVPAARLYIVLDEPVTHKVSWQVRTNPAVRIRYNGRATDGLSLVEIASGAQSDPIIIEPTEVGSIEVAVTQSQNGPSVRQVVQVIPDVPSRVSIAPTHARVLSDVALLPLVISLVGQDGAPLRALAELHEIELKSSTTAWNFDERVTLLPGKPVATHMVQLPRFRLGANLNLLANDGAGSLRGDALDLQVVAARSAVLVLAILAGMLGSVTRFVYRDRKVHLYPRVVKDAVEPGLLVTGAFGGLFGAALLQAIDVGLLHMVVGNVEHEELRLAFLIGLVGGFAGIRVFDMLSKVVLQGTQHRHSAAPTS